ncbi:hypothetical protein ACIQWR_36215 [Streptomyces sp. NPDC098789]|uniref:hypothetical protein n=1 Tax=Streptomyces sp. NPDC098789 TaxID=3366098 RepID=UPI0037F1F084
MSEIADTPVPAAPPVATAPTVAAVRTTPPPVRTAREAYSFACMKCGYGWEQAYEIEHHVDGRGQPFIVYTVKGGERVPSPLSNPTCMNCGGHVVRIMREGQVSSVLGMLDQLHHHHHRAAPARMPKPRKVSRLHDAPGPVAIDPDAGGGGGGLLGRLWRRIRGA